MNDQPTRRDFFKYAGVAAASAALGLPPRMPAEEKRETDPATTIETGDLYDMVKNKAGGVTELIIHNPGHADAADGKKDKIKLVVAGAHFAVRSLKQDPEKYDVDWLESEQDEKKTFATHAVVRYESDDPNNPLKVVYQSGNARDDILKYGEAPARHMDESAAHLTFVGVDPVPANVAKDPDPMDMKVTPAAKAAVEVDLTRERGGWKPDEPICSSITFEHINPRLKILPWIPDCGFHHHDSGDFQFEIMPGNDTSKCAPPLIRFSKERDYAINVSTMVGEEKIAVDIPADAATQDDFMGPIGALWNATKQRLPDSAPVRSYTDYTGMDTAIACRDTPFNLSHDPSPAQRGAPLPRKPGEQLDIIDTRRRSSTPAADVG